MDKTGCCFVFGAAPIKDYGFIDTASADYVICADGGYKHAKKLGLEIGAVVGDFDSGNRPQGDFVIEYPRQKDETDMLLAIKAGLCAGYRSFKIYGGLGGRFDHSLANVSLLVYLNRHGAKGELIDENNSVFVLSDYQTFEVKRKDEYKISLLAFSQTVTGVTLKGFYYPLENAVLNNGDPVGVSNELTGAQGEVSIEKGDLIIAFSKD